MVRHGARLVRPAHQDKKSAGDKTVNIPRPCGAQGLTPCARRPLGPPSIPVTLRPAPASAAA